MSNDAISRSEAMIALSKVFGIPLDYDGNCNEMCDEAFATIEALPALDVVPVVHARWDRVEREAFWIGDQDEWMRTGKPTKRVMPVCSKCKNEYSTAAFEHKYCPNCGARMDGEAE